MNSKYIWIPLALACLSGGSYGGIEINGLLDKLNNYKQSHSDTYDLLNESDEAIEVILLASALSDFDPVDWFVLDGGDLCSEGNPAYSVGVVINVRGKNTSVQVCEKNGIETLEGL